MAQTISTENTIQGPYSAWPRQRSTFRRNASLATGAVAAALFVHCGVPLIF